MKKLENIPKKNIFEVPDGYFDRLPGVIQARTAGKETMMEERPYWMLALRYAVPVVVLMAASFFFYQNFATSNAESMLASVSSEALVDYLDEAEISTEEFLETVGYENIDVDGLDANPIMEFDLDDVELEDLSEEYQNEL